jgi:hypothetical protein
MRKLKPIYVTKKYQLFQNRKFMNSKFIKDIATGEIYFLVGTVSRFLKIDDEGLTISNADMMEVCKTTTPFYVYKSNVQPFKNK